MLKFIRKLLGLCEHDWVEIDRKVIKRSYWHKPGWTFSVMHYVNRCEKCKDLKINRVDPV